MTFRETTDALSLSQEEVAKTIGRKYPTVLSYRRGEREVPADVWRALAKLARTHGAHVQETARELAAIAREAERAERGRS